MLIRFRVSNFRSLRDEQELSMVASLRDGRQDLVRVGETGVDLVRCAAIYGANASGKSNVLAALEFLREAVTSSHRQWRPGAAIPRSPFLLDPVLAEHPSELESDFLLDGVRHRYGFRLDRNRVLAEWLYVYSGKRRLLFSRDAGAAEPFKFGKQLRGNNRTIASLARENSLFLSAAAENNHPALSPVYRWFATHIQVIGGREHCLNAATLQLCSRSEKKAAVLKWLQLADLGITDLVVRSPPALDRVEFRHRARTQGGSTTLPLWDESRGTQTWFLLAEPILTTLDNGGVLCIDELDASLHPHLAMEVVRIFQDPIRNPKNAQLIFTTHDTTLLGGLLGEPALHRDQIWFTEKDSEGATHLYPLTDFKPRKSENLERGYLQGRYGAVPFVGWEPAESDG